MNRLEIQETANSPHILFDSEKGIFAITGKSFPEDSKFFFQPALEWLKDFKKEKPSTIKFDINLFYLSSSSVISVKQILMLLMECEQAGATVVVNWFHDEDDDDIKKTGEDYMRLTKLNFAFKINEE